MLTFSCAKTRRPSRRAAFASAACALAILSAAAGPGRARAEEIESDGCVRDVYTSDCVSRSGPAVDPFVRIVPAPADAAEKAHADERERRWVDRCRPIIRPDRYGVGRYYYAVPGCEFGIGY